MAHKQLFVIVMFIAFASLAAAESQGGACGFRTVANDPNKGCATTCPASCNNRNPKKACQQPCITDGCSCQDGFIRTSGLKSKCILPAQCP